MGPLRLTQDQLWILNITKCYFSVQFPYDVLDHSLLLFILLPANVLFIYLFYFILFYFSPFLSHPPPPSLSLSLSLSLSFFLSFFLLPFFLSFPSFSFLSFFLSLNAFSYDNQSEHVGPVFQGAVFE